MREFFEKDKLGSDLSALTLDAREIFEGLWRKFCQFFKDLKKRKRD